MKRLSVAVAGLLVIAFTVFGCAHMGSAWVTLIDGEKGLENFNRVGDANWRAEGGAIVADKGKGGHLVTKTSYKDFEIRAEFWAESSTNSGIFIRQADPNKPAAATGYEVNIWDTRPEPKYGTGAIVDVAAVPVPLANKAGGRWNTYEITAKGSHLTVRLNGIVTADVQNDKFPTGYVSLQFGAGPKNAPGGPIKWRKVQIRTL